MTLNDLLEIFPFADTRDIIMDNRYRTLRYSQVKRNLCENEGRTQIPYDLIPLLSKEVLEFWSESATADISIALDVNKSEHEEYAKAVQLGSVAEVW